MVYNLVEYHNLFRTGFYLGELFHNTFEDKLHTIYFQKTRMTCAQVLKMQHKKIDSIIFHEKFIRQKLQFEDSLECCKVVPSFRQGWIVPRGRIS